jgi:hypothetical protein
MPLTDGSDWLFCVSCTMLVQAGVTRDSRIATSINALSLPPDPFLENGNHYQILVGLLTKMKKELSILRGRPQGRKQVPHGHSEMFVMLID